MAGRLRHKDNLLEIVEPLLQKIGQPVHYRMLCDLLIDCELWDGRGKDRKAAQATLYTALHHDILVNKEDSAFRMFEGGVFCASTIRGVDQVCIPPEQMRNNRKPHIKEEQKIPQDARCGNCKFIRFEGIEIVKLSRGICQESKFSQRYGVSVNAPPCEMYMKRTDRQIQRDEKRKNDGWESAAKVVKKR